MFALVWPVVPFVASGGTRDGASVDENEGVIYLITMVPLKIASAIIISVVALVARTVTCRNGHEHR